MTRPWIAAAALLAGCQPDVVLNEVSGTLTLWPVLADAGVIAPGEVVTLDIELRHLAGRTVVVDEVTLDDPDGVFSLGEAPASVAPDEVGRMTLTYAPVAEGWHTASIQVRTPSLDEPLVLPARGRAGTATLRAWPALRDFGAAAPGETVTRAITVENTGAVGVSLSSVTVPPGAFALAASLPVTLGPGARADVAFTFAPVDTEPAFARVRLEDATGLGTAAALRGNDCLAGTVSAYDLDGDGWTSCAGDCDDLNPDIHPGAVEVCNGRDTDCNGLVDDRTPCYDDDGDGLSEDQGDCVDSDPAIAPTAPEIPDNGIDDDCDGVVDAGAFDADGDGFTIDGGDCDDANPAAFPGAPEACNGTDNDCDTVPDNGTSCVDDDGDGVSEDDGDCDDTDPLVYPGAPERPNWIDDDCDNRVDEGTIRADDDGDGWTEVGGDCDDTDPNVFPGQGC